MYYKTNEYTYNFQSDEDQSSLLVEIVKFRKQVKPKNPEKKSVKKMFLETYIIFWKVEKEFLMLLKVKVSIKIDHSNLKIITPKKVLQRLPIALAKIKAVY